MSNLLSTTFGTPRAKIIILLVFVFFIADCCLPYGINGAAFYAPLILFSAVGTQRFFTFSIAFLVSLLLVVAFFLKSEGVPLHHAFINRAITLGTIWVAAFTVILIQRSNERYEAVWRQDMTGLILVDHKGEIVQISPAINQFFGFEGHELLGQKIETLIPERFRQKHQEHRSHFQRDPQPRAMGHGLNLFGRRKDGSDFPVEVSLSPFKSSGGDYVIIFLLDITNRKKQEEALLGQKRELEALAGALQDSNRELEQFAYVSSHDLQEPLRKIRAFSDLLAEPESGVLTEEGADYLKRIQQSAGRMQQLIRDLLNFSRLSTRAQPFSVVNLNHILTEVLSDLDLLIRETEAKITIGELPQLAADPTQMRQLFQNLMSNALKFRQENQATMIKVWAQPSVKGDNWTEIWVQDNGIGFDEKYADRIFTIFQRLDGQKYDGSGIGLAICKKIVQRHGGEITAKSAPGQGASFIVSLPIHQSNENDLL